MILARPRGTLAPLDGFPARAYRQGDSVSTNAACAPRAVPIAMGDR